MTTIDDGPDPLEHLRDAVVSLAAARFEKYYHHSTGLHIVKQLEGTHFHDSGVFGTGKFADVAYREYTRALASHVVTLTGAALRLLEARLAAYAPVGVRRVEIQVRLPGTFAAEINARAKEMSQGVGVYVGRLIERCLPLTTDETQIASFVEWYAGFAGAVAVRSGKTFHLSVPLQYFERLELIADRLPQDGLRTVGDVASTMILAQRSSPRRFSRAAG